VVRSARWHRAGKADEVLVNYLAAGAPVVNIVRMDPLRLRAEIPERESRTVRTVRMFV
jgi:hypothetical protein